jgi:hypothetical protein
MGKMVPTKPPVATGRVYFDSSGGKTTALRAALSYISSAARMPRHDAKSNNTDIAGFRFESSIVQLVLRY